MTDLVSRVYRPSPAKCCEACAFGAGKHQAWCPVALNAEGHHHDDCLRQPEEDGRWSDDGGFVDGEEAGSES